MKLYKSDFFYQIVALVLSFIVVHTIYVGLVRPNADAVIEAEWIAPRPNTDTALMMGLAHTLVAEGLHDEAFLADYAVGFNNFRPYLMGETDGQAKSAEWAAEITGVGVDDIRALARRMPFRATACARRRPGAAPAEISTRPAAASAPVLLARLCACAAGRLCPARGRLQSPSVAPSFSPAFRAFFRCSLFCFAL